MDGKAPQRRNARGTTDNKGVDMDKRTFRAKKWMRPYLTGAPGAVLARVASGRWSWDLDDRLHALPGSQRIGGPGYDHWALVPEESLDALRGLISPQPESFLVYAA